jgi:hypothetical protein
MKSKFEKCLEPTFSCSAAAIRAHSIQNSGVLDLLVEDGHVIALRPIVEKSGPIIRFDSVGRNLVSTFTGMCSAHDTEIFKPLDTRPFDDSNPEQLFLLAYRSVTRELHAVMESGAKVQSGYQYRVEHGMDRANEMSQAMLMATQQLARAYETYRYRVAHFDLPFLAKNYASVVHDVLTFEDQPPTVAASAFFGLENEREFYGCAVNVFPVTASVTKAVFSYASAHADRCRKAMAKVLLAPKESQRLELSRLVLQRIENFVLNPAFYRSWGRDREQTILAAFTDTLMVVRELPNDPELSLFD